MSEQTATKYTVLNLKEVDNQGSNFGIPEDSYTFRMARVPLGCENSGVSHVWMAPGYRQPFGHKHKRQEEIYVLVNGNMRAKLDEDIVELKPWDAVRIATEDVEIDRTIKLHPDFLEDQELIANYVSRSLVEAGLPMFLRVGEMPAHICKKRFQVKRLVKVVSQKFHVQDVEIG